MGNGAHQWRASGTFAETHIRQQNEVSMVIRSSPRFRLCSLLGIRMHRRWSSTCEKILEWWGRNPLWASPAWVGCRVGSSPASSSG
jgi:hypothetical protein